MAEYLELILGIFAVIIIPLGGVVIKMWSDVQTIKPVIAEIRIEIKDLETDKVKHSTTLAVIDQKLQHIDTSIISLTASVTQLIQTFDRMKP